MDNTMTSTKNLNTKIADEFQDLKAGLLTRMVDSPDTHNEPNYEEFIEALVEIASQQAWGGDWEKYNEAVQKVFGVEGYSTDFDRMIVNLPEEDVRRIDEAFKSIEDDSEDGGGSD